MLPHTSVFVKMCAVTCYRTLLPMPKCSKICCITHKLVHGSYIIPKVVSVVVVVVVYGLSIKHMSNQCLNSFAFITS